MFSNSQGANWKGPVTADLDRDRITPVQLGGKPLR